MLKKGDLVFFAENSGDSGILEGNFGAEFYRIAALELGLHAIFYTGIGLAARQSNLDKEIRDDFYRARACALYFGEPKDASTPDDHWALPELSHAISLGIECLIYVAPNFPTDQLPAVGYSDLPRIVRSKEEFCEALRADLTRLLRE
jgi:hypothetical protein